MKKQPYLVTLEKGKNYAWCECAESQTQPFCDGSHTKVNKRNENLVENLQEISLISKDSQKLRKLNVIVILKFLIASLKTLDYKRIIQH